MPVIRSLISTKPRFAISRAWELYNHSEIILIAAIFRNIGAGFKESAGWFAHCTTLGKIIRIVIER